MHIMHKNKRENVTEVSMNTKTKQKWNLAKAIDNYKVGRNCLFLRGSGHIC